MLIKLALFAAGSAALLAMTAESTDAADPPGKKKNPVVAIETSLGTIKVELFEDKAPVTVKNFLSYVDEKFYDNTVFHRVIGKEGQLARGASPKKARDFMVQGGGFGADLKEKVAKEPIVNEAKTAKVSNTKGTIAMARTTEPNSATAQFYLNVADNDFLDPNPDLDPAGYCAFGKVVDGLAVLEKIKAVKVKDSAPAQVYNKRLKRHAAGDLTDVPVETILIKSVRRVTDKDEKKPAAVEKKPE